MYFQKGHQKIENKGCSIINLIQTKTVLIAPWRALWQRPHTLPNPSVRTVTTEAVFHSAMLSQSTHLPLLHQQPFKKNMQKKHYSLHGGSHSLYTSPASVDDVSSFSTL